MSELRENMISEVVRLGWDENISYGELAYLADLTDSELTELLFELQKRGNK